MGAAEKQDDKEFNYEALEQARAKEIQLRLTQALASKKTGKTDSLRSTVLSLVIQGRYDNAINAVESYILDKKDYPNFQFRANQYLRHSGDIIRAIEGKRTLQGVHTLNTMKQQELYEKVLDHFDELKGLLKQIEMIERDVKLTDVKSTTIFLKTVMAMSGLLVSVGIIIEITSGLATSAVWIANHYLNVLANWFVNLI